MIGLGSYSFFWRQSAKNPKPLSLIEVFTETKNLGINLFQICDYADLEIMSNQDLESAAEHAKTLGLTIELGTKGIEPWRMSKFLGLAKIFDAKLIRSMTYSSESKPSKQEAIETLKAQIMDFEQAGVVLALETYELISTKNLVDIVNAVASPNLGICLDPANVVANLENPRECVELTAKHVKNVHAKDFAFSRQEGWVGFTYGGAEMGTGLHDYSHLLAKADPRSNGVNEIIEHWLPWQGDIAKTIELEKRWTQKAIEYIRSTK